MQDVDCGLIALEILGHIRCGKSLFWNMTDWGSFYTEKFGKYWTAYASGQFINHMDWVGFHTSYKSDRRQIGTVWTFYGSGS